MSNKQDENKEKGETTTRRILGSMGNLYIHQPFVDVEGRDFFVEIKRKTINERLEALDKIQVFGVVQSKYFENKNEVKVTREYVEDHTGIRNYFFVFVITYNADGEEIVYFFTANEVKYNWTLRTNSKGKVEYVFSITNNKFNNFRSRYNPRQICEIIEKELNSVEEFKNHQFIEKVRKNTFKLSVKNNQKEDTEFKNRIAKNNIVDKLYEIFKRFDDIPFVSPFYIAKQINKYTEEYQTYYNDFSLKTENPEIIHLFELFSQRSVNKKLDDFLQNIDQANEKINYIIDRLKNNLILKIVGKSNRAIVHLSNNNTYECLLCQFEQLNFYKVALDINTLKKDITIEEGLNHAYASFLLKNYKHSNILLEKTKILAIEKGQSIPYFYSIFNLNRLSSHISGKGNYDLFSEMLDLNTTFEKKEFLRDISESINIQWCKNEVIFAYDKIKEYKKRNTINDTIVLVQTAYQYSTYLYYFARNNSLMYSEYWELNPVFEKFIETCVISYSMKTKYSNHLNELNDFIVKIALLYCEPINLHRYFERNKVYDINYISDGEYFQKCVDNFFSSTNIDFVIDKVEQKNGRIENVDLYNKICQIFSNLIILTSKVNLTVKLPLSQITTFIDKVKLSDSEISWLALLFFKDEYQYSRTDYQKVIEVVLKNEAYQKSYLLTNILSSAFKKNIKLNINIEVISNLAVSQPKFLLLSIVSKYLNPLEKKSISQKVKEQLIAKFDSELFYQASINDLYWDREMLDKACDYVIARLNLDNSFSMENSPYTGIPNYLETKMLNIIELCLKFNLNLSDTYRKAFNKLPKLFRFLLDIDKFSIEDTFDLNWILVCHKPTILNKLKDNDRIAYTVNNIIHSTNNIEILKLWYRN